MEKYDDIDKLFFDNDDSLIKIYLDKEIERREVVHIYRDEAKLKEIEIREREKKEAEEKAALERRAQAQALNALKSKFRSGVFIALLVAIILGLFWYNDYRVLIFIPITIILAILTPIQLEEGKELRGYFGLFIVYWITFNWITMLIHSIFAK